MIKVSRSEGIFCAFFGIILGVIFFGLIGGILGYLIYRCEFETE
jgi:hypothetical protein